MHLISKLFRRKPETFVPVKSWNFGVDDWETSKRIYEENTGDIQEII